MSGYVTTTSLLEVVVAPGPFQKPHPPILIGSWGSDIGLRRVAKYGDGWMASAYNITPDKFKEKWKTLLSHSEEMGKDTTRNGHYLASMFGYIDNNKQKIHKMVKDVLSHALRTPADQLERVLLYGSDD